MTVVLVADADELVLRLLETSLDIFGYEVVSARNGLLAAELAERTRPAVAVIDAALPGIDGAEVARRIAASGHTPRTRVLLIAAWATNIDVRYADAILQKPFRLEELAERVRALCGE